jgi:hypothetical protein
MLMTLKQCTKYSVHYEGKGYLTSRPKHATGRKDGTNFYVMYRTKEPIPLKDQKVMISKMHGKMEGVGSISTNPTENKFCRVMSQGSHRGKGRCTGSVCRRCYSVSGLIPGKDKSKPAPRETSIAGLSRNSRLLSQQIIENVPKIKQHFFRFSAEGELINEVHLLNLYKIARANPGVRFTLWTKRPDIVASTASKYGRSYPKPQNLHLIRSAPYLNTPVDIPRGFEKVFTVYTPEYLEKHPEIKIICGAKSCVNCKVCYTNNNIRYVSEKLKPGSRMVGKKP